MKEIKREKIGPYVVDDGDTFSLVYTNRWGEEHLLIEEDIRKHMDIDTAIIFEVEPGEYGLKVGYAGMVGEQEDMLW